MAKVYKYTLDSDYVFYNILPECDDVIFKSNKGNLLLSLVSGTVTIHAGYSWDGCTPKIKVFGKIIGTPDGKHDETKRASCIHDALYQSRKAIKKLTQKKADKIFLDELKEAKWKCAGLYYFAVRSFGWIYFHT